MLEYLTDKMEYASNTSCIQLSHHSVSCHGVEYFLPEEPLTAKHQLFWLYLIGYISVVLFAGKNFELPSLTQIKKPFLFNAFIQV